MNAFTTAHILHHWTVERLPFPEHLAQVAKRCVAFGASAPPPQGTPQYSDSEEEQVSGAPAPRPRGSPQYSDDEVEEAEGVAAGPAAGTAAAGTVATGFRPLTVLECNLNLGKAESITMGGGVVCAVAVADTDFSP